MESSEVKAIDELKREVHMTNNFLAKIMETIEKINKKMEEK